MGAGVTLAEGFYDAFHQDGKLIPILASVGDSTFLHACLAPLYDAVKNRKRFILVIMDNSTTAMTGMQPVYDPVRFLAFAKPVVCRADDERTLYKEIVVPDRPRTLVVEGICPGGCSHETVEY